MTYLTPQEIIARQIKLHEGEIARSLFDDRTKIVFSHIVGLLDFRTVEAQTLGESEATIAGRRLAMELLAKLYQLATGESLSATLEEED